MLNRIIFIVFFSLPFFSCKKHHDSPADNPYGLPNATQNGSNIFACLMNGKKFIGYYNPSNGSGAKVTGDTLGITGVPKNKTHYEFLGFRLIGDFMEIQNYFIDAQNNYGIYGTDSTCLGVSFNQTTCYAINGNIKLTKFDTSKKIVSGIFNCTIPVPNCDTLKITEGRFDIVYH